MQPLSVKVAPHHFYQVLVIQAELLNHQGGAPRVIPCVYILLTHKTQDIYLYFECFTSIPTALTANDRNRRIQVYQDSSQ